MNDDDKPIETISPIDYAVLMRNVLTQLKEGIDTLEATVIAVPHLKNLAVTALDYLFYLEDNRRVME